MAYSCISDVLQPIAGVWEKPIRVYREFKQKGQLVWTVDIGESHVAIGRSTTPQARVRFVDTRGTDKMARLSAVGK